MSQVCPACRQSMEPGDGCTLATFDDLEAGPWKRIPCASKECLICKASRGQFHHVGCDVEECPSCGSQANSCDCKQVDGDGANDTIVGQDVTPDDERGVAAEPEKVEHTEPEPVDPIHRGWETSE